MLTLGGFWTHWRFLLLEFICQALLEHINYSLVSGFDAYHLPRVLPCPILSPYPTPSCHCSFPLYICMIKSFISNKHSSHLQYPKDDAKGTRSALPPSLSSPGNVLPRCERTKKKASAVTSPPSIVSYQYPWSLSDPRWSLVGGLRVL